MRNDLIMIWWRNILEKIRHNGFTFQGKSVPIFIKLS